jgi:hypothetical protein
MIHHLVAVSAITAHVGRPAPRPAISAPAAVVRDGGRHGNGHHNRNIISAHSPTRNRGYQHTNNSNAGGTNPVQNALCRHVTVCTISQKVSIVRPERPAPPPTIVPIQAIPEPQRAFGRPEREPESERPPVRRPIAWPPHGPFMYLGPEGFLLMAPDSGAPALFGSSIGRAFPAGLFG